MTFRLGLVAVLCCAFSLVAQQQMTVEQMVDMVRQEVAMRRDDRSLAAYLKKVKLTDKLTDKAIQDLLAQGAGPKTVDALKKLRDETANLKPPAVDPTYSPATAPENTSSTRPTTALGSKPALAPPTSEKQAEILDEIKQYASTYTQSLPNFICTQVTRRYIDPTWTPKTGDNWRSIDTVTTKLSYENGREKYVPVLYNNRPIVGNFDPEHLRGGGTVSSGEFGTLMRGIFESRSNAQFDWDHWGNLDGKLLAVYSYFIDSGHSDYSIDYNGEQRIITAYKGQIYADPYTGIIYRIKFEAVDIPSTFPVQSATEQLDYGETEISQNKYICPERAQVFLRAGREKTRNDIVFRLYKKFETGSVITYQVDTGAAPVPDSGDKPLQSSPNEPDIPLPPNSAPPPPPDPVKTRQLPPIL